MIFKDQAELHQEYLKMIDDFMSFHKEKLEEKYLNKYMVLESMMNNTKYSLCKIIEVNPELSYGLTGLIDKENKMCIKFKCLDCKNNTDFTILVGDFCIWKHNIEFIFDTEEEAKLYLECL